MNYSIAEATERIGLDWCRLNPAAAKQFKQERNDAEYKAAVKEHDAKLEELRKLRTVDTLEFRARLVNPGSAPGYRDVYLTLDLKPEPNGEIARPMVRATMSLFPQDGESVVRDISRIHRWRWRAASALD